MNNITINSNSNDIKEMEKLFPRAPLKIIAMEGCKELGQKVNDYVFQNWAVFYKGKFETVNLLDVKALQKLLK